MTSVRWIGGRRTIVLAAVLAALALGLHSAPVLSQEGSAAVGSGYNYNPIETQDAEAASLTDLLAERTKELDAREALLREEEERLGALKIALDAKLVAIDEANVRLEKTLAAMKEVDEKKLVDLAKIYENMPPEEGARRIAEVDPDLAVKILKRMQSRKSGRMLAFVEPEKAAELSEGFGMSMIPGKDISR